MSNRDFLQKFVLDRFNSFLVATAFLIAAFITLAIYYEQSCDLLLLAYAVNAVALYLATFFTVANYHGALCINYALDIKSEEVEGRNEPHKLLWYWLKGLIHFPLKPFSESIPVVHTWLIPFLFCLFWLTTWFGVLPVRWVPSLIGVGVPLIYLFLLGIISHIKSKLRNKQNDKPAI
jgi:hypothetical protein